MQPDQKEKASVDDAYDIASHAEPPQDLADAYDEASRSQESKPPAPPAPAPGIREDAADTQDSGKGLLAKAGLGLLILCVIAIGVLISNKNGGITERAMANHGEPNYMLDWIGVPVAVLLGWILCTSYLPITQSRRKIVLLPLALLCGFALRWELLGYDLSRVTYGLLLCLFYAFPLALYATIATSGQWDHSRKDGGADRRFKSNSFQYNYSPEQRHIGYLSSKATFQIVGVGLLLCCIVPIRHFWPDLKSHGRQQEEAQNASERKFVDKHSREFMPADSAIELDKISRTIREAIPAWSNRRAQREWNKQASESMGDLAKSTFITMEHLLAYYQLAKKHEQFVLYSDLVKEPENYKRRAQFATVVVNKVTKLDSGLIMYEIDLVKDGSQPGFLFMRDTSPSILSQEKFSAEMLSVFVDAPSIDENNELVKRPVFAGISLTKTGTLAALESTFKASKVPYFDLLKLKRDIIDKFQYGPREPIINYDLTE